MALSHLTWSHKVLDMCHKSAERIWRREGLKVPRRQPRRGRLWLNDGSCIRLRPEHRDHVWAYDFVSARTHEGLPLRLLVVVDEFTRECLSVDVELSLSSDDVLERLAWLMATSAQAHPQRQRRRVHRGRSA